MEKLIVTFSDYKKSGKVYVRARANVVLLNGEIERLEGYGKNRVEARHSLEKKIQEKNKIIQYGISVNSGDISLSEGVLELIKERALEYDRTMEREKRRDTSIKRDYEAHKALLMPYSIAKKKIKDIYVTDLEKYRKELSNAVYDNKHTSKDHEPEWKHYSSSYLNRIIRLVVKVLDDYYNHRPEKSPTGVLYPFKQSVKEKTEEDFLIGEEIQIALVYFRKVREQKRYQLDATIADLFIIALLSGARPGEVTGLKKRDWNPVTHEIYIKRTGTYGDGRTKTRKSIRKIIVPDEAVDILNRRCSTILDEELIFSGTKKNLLSASNYNKKLKRWIREMGIDKNLHTHSLRGSCGTYLLECGVSLDAVSKMLGHDSIMTTKVYYTTYTETQRKTDAQHICSVLNNL